MRSLVLSAALVSVATFSEAAEFNVFDATDPAVFLGSFTAPEAGGVLTSGHFLIAGGVFDVLAMGADAPVYLPDSGSIDGAGSTFGAIYNSSAFDYDDAGSTLTCEVEACPLLFESAFDDVPGEWYVEDLDHFTNVGFGHYTIVPVAAVPVPAAGVLAGLGLGALAVLRRRQR